MTAIFTWNIEVNYSLKQTKAFRNWKYLPYLHMDSAWLVLRNLTLRLGLKNNLSAALPFWKHTIFFDFTIFLQVYSLPKDDHKISLWIPHISFLWKKINVWTAISTPLSKIKLEPKNYRSYCFVKSNVIDLKQNGCAKNTLHLWFL